MRCPEPCGKIRFPDRNTALLACVKLAMYGVLQAPVYGYDCEGYCWHTTSQVFGRGREKSKLGRKLQEYSPAEVPDLQE